MAAASTSGRGSKDVAVVASDTETSSSAGSDRASPRRLEKPGSSSAHRKAKKVSSPSRSPSRRSRRSRSRRSPGGKGSKGGLNPSISKRHTVLCWYGRACPRPCCWFKHPDGRDVDDKRVGKGGKGGGRKILPCAFRRRRSASPQRSPLRRSRTPSPPPRLRFSSRSPSQKPPAPPRVPPAPTPSPEKPKKVAPPLEVEAKKPSFRDFVLHHISEEDSPIRTIQLWAEHLGDLEKVKLDAIKESGLFHDLYNPLARASSRDRFMSLARHRAESFMAEVREGRYRELSLRCSQARTGASSPVAGHLQPPEFAFDPDVNSLMISGLPPAVSVWDVLNALQDRQGFHTAAWTPRFKRGLTRDFYARFASNGDATAAAVGLMQSSETLLGGEGDAGAGRVSVLSSKPDLSALALPQEMSLPERLMKDLALSEEVLRRLDGLVGMPPEISSDLLGVVGSTEFKLDLRILYLRRVHHFCFYAAQWCNDEWSLRDACGVATVREQPQPGCQPGAWSEAHEKRLEDFLANVSLEQPADIPSYTHPRVVERVAKEREAAIQKVTDEKFKCQLCSKSFRGPDFVRKHLGRMHLALVEAARDQLLAEHAAEAWMADPERPVALQR